MPHQRHQSMTPPARTTTTSRSGLFQAQVIPATAVDAARPRPNITTQLASAQHRLDWIAINTPAPAAASPARWKPAVSTIPPARGEAVANQTGLPDDLKSGIEALSGLSLDGVKVHYNSARPAQLNALAYTQGRDIHVAPGQERHLPHEAWHVVQQAQGRVKPTMQMKGRVSVNDDRGLEREADVMGARATGVVKPDLPRPAVALSPDIGAGVGGPIQRKKIIRNGVETQVPDDYTLQPGESEINTATGQQLTRRRVGVNQDVQERQTGYHPPGRPYMATRDSPDSHGPRAWASTAFMVGSGTIDPLALKNAGTEALAHNARAKAEKHNAGFVTSEQDEQLNGPQLARERAEELRNARLSTAQAGVAAAQAGTATPLGHIANQPWWHKIFGSVPNVGGDLEWYGGHALKDRFQKMKIKQKR